MQRRSHPAYVFVLLVLVPVLIVVGISLYLGKSSRQLAPAAEVSFRTTTGPPLRFVSSLAPAASPSQSRGTASTSAAHPEIPDIIELPILVIGDTADPRFIRRDFHPIPGGYRAIDHTRRRVLTMDTNLQVTAVLDRSEAIPNGLWQDIDVCRVDSRGAIYLLDQAKGLVQVLDENGNYLRRHRDLGIDLFGSPLEPKDLAIDSLDRLWIIGESRIFILDRDGNLVQIFESRGAPYVRPAQSGKTVIASEHTPLGYTILPSADPLLGRRDPTEPITLDVSGFSEVDLPSAPDSPRLFYVQQQAALDEAVVFDRNGKERGSIDLAALAGSNNRSFLVGPDGYCYLVNPERSYITVTDPLGEQLARIEVEGLPQEGWGPALGPSYATPGSTSRVRGFIDEDGRFLVFDTQTSELMLFPLREGDKLGEGLEDLD